MESSRAVPLSPFTGSSGPEFDPSRPPTGLVWGSVDVSTLTFMRWSWGEIMRGATKLLQLCYCSPAGTSSFSGFENLHFHVFSVEHTYPSPVPYIGWWSDLCDQPARRENIRRASIHSLDFLHWYFPLQSICCSQIQKAWVSRDYFIVSSPEAWFIADYVHHFLWKNGMHQSPIASQKKALHWNICHFDAWKKPNNREPLGLGNHKFIWKVRIFTLLMQ